MCDFVPEPRTSDSTHQRPKLSLYWEWDKSLYQNLINLSFFSVIVIGMLFYISISLKTKMFMFRVCFIEKVRMLQKIRIAESWKSYFFFSNDPCAKSFVVILSKFKIPQLHLLSNIFTKFQVAMLYSTWDMRLGTGPVFFGTPCMIVWVLRLQKMHESSECNKMNIFFLFEMEF